MPGERDRTCPSVGVEGPKDVPTKSVAEPRGRTSSCATMIPLPRSGQFASQNQKVAKTEKNRLRLTMESILADILEKEERVANQDNRRRSRNRGSTIPRYLDERKKGGEGDRSSTPLEETEVWSERGSRVVLEEEEEEEGGRVAVHGAPAGVGVGVGAEADVSARLASSQRRPRRVDGATPLRSVVADIAGVATLESPADAAAAFIPVVAALASSSTGARASNRLVDAPPPPVARLPVLRHEKHRKENAMEPEAKEEDERRSSTPSPEFYTGLSKRYNEDGSSEEESRLDSSPQNPRVPSSYRGTWPVRRDLWANQQTSFSNQPGVSATARNDVASVMSFSSSSTETQGHRRLGAKVDVVYNLLGMLGSTEGREDMSATLLSMSSSIDSCLVMRQSGCLPLLVQLIHAPGQDPETRERASRALRNVVHAKSDEKAGRREARVLRFLEQLRDYCQALRASLESGQIPELDRHPGPTIAALMKLSFDEAHRHAMCQLGGLHAVAELIEMDHLAHGSECDDQNCITVRRYAGMALTNLTFGDGNNKALLCSFREFMKALVSQLRSPSDDLRQVTASVLRNLSWRADSSSKQTLREVGAVTGLTKAAMEGRKEYTLKSILSALWNLSAHCSTNKVDICAVEGALAFLVDMLSYNAPSKTLVIVENAGGILRNVSSHVAVREDYRSIVRERGCLPILLQQLRSPSLTVVSNACGALWNLSARCPQDQRLLWDLGAVPMLRSLVHSKHKMISMGSSAALKNLLSARPGCGNLVHLDSTARGLGLPTLPTLVARRQKALEQEIDQSLAETCDNIEPSTSPTNKDDKFAFKVDHSFLGVNARTLRGYQLHGQPGTSGGKCNGVARSESRESMRSVTSTHSDTMFERVNRHVANGMSPTDAQIKQQSSSLHSAVGFDSGIAEKAHASEKKYTLRYKNAIPERLGSADYNEIGDLRCTNSTISWASAADQESACSRVLLHSSVEDNLSGKAESRSSISEEAEPAVNADYRQKDSSPAKETVNFTGMYGEKPLLLKRDPLNAIQKSMSPAAHDPEIQNDLFGNYAETDLDQPTDYSLRYAESTLEEDEKQHAEYFVSSEQELIHDDTIKTYCTEGTPRGTSLNSSRAASASDLQEDSRTRNSIRKATERNKCKEQPRRETFTLDGDKKSNGFDLVTVDSGVASVTRITGEKLETEMLHYFKSNPKSAEFERIKDTVRNRPSVRTTPTQMASENENRTVVPDRVDVKIDVHDRYEVQTTIFETRSGKDATGSYTGNTASKTSNDSGYQVSDGDEDDEDLLAACINIGMQNNRHRHSFIGNGFEKLPRAECNLTRYQTSVALDQVECTESTTNAHAEEIGSERSDESNTSAEHIGSASEPKYSLLLENTEKISRKAGDRNSLPILSTAEEFKALSNPETEKDVESKEEVGQISIGEPSKEHEERIVSTVKESESSESIDSVEQSEHALLELCIQANENSREEQEETANGSSEREEPSDEIDNGVGRTREDDSKSEETSIKKEEVYRRQRDPDAMIASLDRLTATLVQQTEAMRERDLTTMKQSTISDTWNEDSPNDVSFPSISISAPLIASFKSDVQEDDVREEDVDVEEEEEEEDEDVQRDDQRNAREDPRENQDTIVSEISERMTDSKIIRREAIRLAEAVSAEANKEHEPETATSLTSIDLEAIKPPSSMGSLISLTASYAGSAEATESFVNRDRCHSTSLPPTANQAMNRKKSLPIGVVARRALGHGHNHTGSLESLLNECTNSHLESVKPPSMMDELPDVGDMENSMLSVASITSEIADSKEHDSHSLTGSSDPVFDLLRPMANVLSITCMRYAESMQTSGNNSLSECLENINPPSLFNEVSEMDESTLCIDTELRTDELSRTMVPDKIDEDANDTDDAATPLSSEYCVTSSAESTPKKRFNKNHLTPKQRRNLAKERYKTYTIAAEIVKKEEEQRRKNEGGEKIPRGKCSPFSKLTPKQRRQEDRARFQTQVLEIPVAEPSDKPGEEKPGERAENGSRPGAASPVKSAIPTKLPICRALRKKRIESGDGERYRTRTLNDSEIVHKEPADSSGPSRGEDGRVERVEHEEIQTMLERNAIIVINTLNESSKASDSTGEDFLLDCETLSLVSNDSESERSLRMRFVNGLSQKLMRSSLEARKDENEGRGRERERDRSESDEEPEEEPEEHPPVESKRPRIIKPGMVSRDLSVDSNATDKSEPGSPKAIRGRRKALYSNPITRKPTPQSSPLKQPNPVSGIPIGRSNTSPIVRATRATTLRQNNAPHSAKESPKSASPKFAPAAAASKRVSVPQRGSSLTFAKATKRHSTPAATSSNPETPVKPLERQGTFTKDEPEVGNAPTVFSCPSPAKTKIAKPVRSASTAKAHPAVVKSKISVRTHQAYQTKGADRIQPARGAQTAVAKRLPYGKPSSPAGKTASPAAGTPQPDAGAGKSFKKVGPLGQRSNSNSSIVSNSSSGVQPRKATKEATSKIASLWKRVEETRNRQQRFEKPDSRQWITPACGNAETDGPGCAGGASAAFRLFRSSTFEGVPRETGGRTFAAKTRRGGGAPAASAYASGARYRNSCDLSGMNASEAPCKIPVKREEQNAAEGGGVLLRRHNGGEAACEGDATKRLSRLGSFIRVDPANPESAAQTLVRAPASAIVPPFNYNPKQDIPSAKGSADDLEGKPDASEYRETIVTASARVTTV